MVPAAPRCAGLPARPDPVRGARRGPANACLRDPSGNLFGVFTPPQG